MKRIFNNVKGKRVSATSIQCLNQRAGLWRMKLVHGGAVDPQFKSGAHAINRWFTIPGITGEVLEVDGRKMLFDSLAFHDYDSYVVLLQEVRS